MATNGQSKYSSNEVFSLVTEILMDSPAKLHDADSLVASLQFELRQAKVAMSDAELDAHVNAQVDGKNAETRKLQMEKAVSENATVLEFRGRLSELESSLALAELDQKQ